jgi:8-oxo-dGTP diphosphatase
MSAFYGAKLAILTGDRIVTILRDDVPHIPWPGHWDLPGGGREGSETPEDCVLREVYEELGLSLSASDLHWRLEAFTPSAERVWFFVSEQPDFDPEMVRFGNEGQEWRMVSLAWFLKEPSVIPRHQERLSIYLENIRNFRA